MTQEYLFESLEDLVCKYAKANHHYKVAVKPIVAFHPMVGRNYNHDLMVVGRAPNGWLDCEHEEACKGSDHAGGYTAKVLLESSRAFEQFMTTIREDLEQREDQLRWVVDEWNGDCYQTYRSAFWRTAKKMLRRLGLGDDDDESWSSQLAWTNLYKIAPMCSGNPTTTMCNVQQAGCEAMLSAELKEFKPKRVLFMTGYKDWAKPFLDKLQLQTRKSRGFEYVECSGQLPITKTRFCQVVVVPHPQGKPESELVEQAAKCFESLGAA